MPAVPDGHVFKKLVVLVAAMEKYGSVRNVRRVADAVVNGEIEQLELMVVVGPCSAAPSLVKTPLRAHD